MSESGLPKLGNAIRDQIQIAEFRAARERELHEKLDSIVLEFAVKTFCSYFVQHLSQLRVVVDYGLGHKLGDADYHFPSGKWDAALRHFQKLADKSNHYFKPSNIDKISERFLEETLKINQDYLDEGLELKLRYSGGGWYISVAPLEPIDSVPDVPELDDVPF